MIKAKKNRWADFVFKSYLEHLFRSYFHAFYLSGKAPVFDPDKSILLLPNHNSWWDGFFCFILQYNIIRRSGFLMMLEKELKKNRFFSKIGVFSIDPSSLKGNRESLNYTLQLLNSHQHPFVVIFPQGELLPWNFSNIEYQRGIDFILRHINNPVQICQLAIKCEFTSHQRPDVFFMFSQNMVINEKTSMNPKKLSESHSELLENLQNQILQKEYGTDFWRGKKSINETFESFRRKIGFIKDST